MTRRRLQLFLIISVAQLVVLAGMAHGFNNADVQKLNSTNRCEKCDLSSANLSNTDMYGASLAGANLAGANLSESSFNDADLTGANLKGANLKGTNFAGAKLGNATWADGKKCQPGSIGKCK